ncbi:MAG: TonB-dependent receptor [Prevotellaceae bacterium]|nr:TonB-dependent receptor [Prevotellaceae bacterium]
MKRLAVVLIASMVSTLSFAQINGTVVDQNGEPVIGASVLVKGTSTGAATDLNGKFSIPTAKSSDVLTVSYVGMISQEISLRGKSSVKVVLSEDAKTLNDVVVIGYGTVKRRDLTGSVASVTGEKLAANPVADITQALQGQLPGVNVTSQDGRPGASMSIRVRGGGSVTQSNDPLVVVDGVQLSSASEMNEIPADNIESIDVLKDAATTAIYGASGANGVILITTKGGQIGKPKVRYNMYYQIKKIPEVLDIQSAYDMVRDTWSYAAAYGDYDAYAKGIAQYYGLGSAYGNHLNDYKNVSAHNYMEDVLKTAHTWNHDVSLSAGTESTKIFATVNYMNDDGIRINSGFKRWSANFKLDQKITKNLKTDLDVRYTETTLTGDHFSNASAYGYRPIDKPLGTDDANLLGMGSSNVDEWHNPLALVDNYDYGREMQRLRARVGLSWNAFKGFTARTELTLGRHWAEAKSWDAGLENSYNSAKLNNSHGYHTRWTTTVNYDVQGLGEDHALSFLAGNEVTAFRTSSNELYGYGFPAQFTKEQAFANINMSNMYGGATGGKDYVKSNDGLPVHKNSWFGRANYSYLGRYLLTATFRADGSSKFAPNHHWGYFPAFAAGWRISDEPFMQSASSWLDNLKLRLSYGTSGSDDINSSLWKETWGTSVITVDGQSITTYVPGSMKPNPNLKWETTIQRNFGIDFAMFNSRLNGSIDLYWNTTKDILMQVPCDASSGYKTQFQNVGKTSNKGVELALAYDIIRTKDWQLGVNLTYNYNHNNVEELLEGVNSDINTGWGSTMRKPAYDYIIREGEPVGTIQGYKSLGYFTIDEFNYDSTTGKYTLKYDAKAAGVATAGNYAANVLALAADGKIFPGAHKFEADENGDAKAQVIGHTMPKHTGGFNINGRWKNLDFALGFTYQIGGDVYNANAMRSVMGDKDSSFGRSRLANASDCFKYYDFDSNGDIHLVTEPSALAALNANTSRATYYAEYGLTTSEYIEDASFLRLNTLTVGYTLPKVWTKPVGISNFRVYFTAGNLFCITGYSGLDPDVNTTAFTGGFPTPNYDYQAYPKARTFTFGVNVAF